MTEQTSKNTAISKSITKATMARPKRLGLTMVETLLVLLIISGFIIGALAAFNAAQTRSKNNNMRTDLTRAVAVIQQASQASGGYGNSGDDLGALLQGETFSGSTVGTSADTTNTNTVLKTPLSSEITFLSTGTGFTLTQTTTDAQTCRAAIEPFLGDGSGVSIYAVNGTAISDPTPSDIATACAAATNAVTLTF